MLMPLHSRYIIRGHLHRIKWPLEHVARPAPCRPARWSLALLKNSCPRDPPIYPGYSRDGVDVDEVYRSGRSAGYGSTSFFSLFSLSVISG